MTSHPERRDGEIVKRPAARRATPFSSRLTGKLAVALILVAYFGAAAMAYWLVAVPYLERKSDLNLGADSLLYLDEAYYLDGQDLGTFFPVTYNVVGPVLVLRALDYNNFLVFCLNCVLFLAGYLALAPTEDRSRIVFLVLLCLSPMTFVTLLTINKEIFSMAGIAFIACYARTGHWRYVPFAIVLSFLARWQQSLAIIAFIPFARLTKVRYRVIVLVSLVAFISLTYPNIKVIPDDTDNASPAEPNAILDFLNDLQTHYMYFLALTPKLILNLIYPSNFFRLREVDYKNIYITYVMFFHPLFVLAILVGLGWFRRLTLRSDLVYLSLFIGITFATIAIIHTRYFYCLYPLLCLELARPNQINSAQSNVAHPKPSSDAPATADVGSTQT
jgi:hypothetical protein